MGLAFSDTTNFKGLVQQFEQELEMGRQHISGNTNRLKDFTALANVAYDDFMAIAIPASGKWQFDDSNQTDFPIITTNLKANQRDYTITNDETGNLILDVHKVMILPSATDTIYQEVFPIDQQSDPEAEGFWDGQDTTGSPYYYDKTGNIFFLDPMPDYNSTNGLKIMINREPVYFAYTDSTKKPGVPGIFHSWFYKKPALEYAKRHSLNKVKNLSNDVEQLKQDIIDYFSKRGRDERDIIKPEPIIYE